MKASKLIEALQSRIAKFGDLEVTLLDDWSGEYEPVEAVYYYNNKGRQEFELATERQAEF